MLPRPHTSHARTTATVLLVWTLLASGCGSVVSNAGGGGSGGAGSAGGTTGAAGTTGTAGAGGAAAGTGGRGGVAGSISATGSGGLGGAGGSVSAAGTGGGAAGGLDGAAGGPADAGTDVDTRDCAVKINEIQTGGATALDEFVELYNSCPDRPVDLTGYALVYRSAAGTTDLNRVAFTSGMIAADKPYFLCANTGYAGTADVRYTDGLAADGGGLALRGPDGRIVDSVGWGTATNAFVEGTAAIAPQAGQSITRHPDGRDTNDNSADFIVRTAPTSPGGPN